MSNKTYSAKSSAIRAAKKQFAVEFENEMVTIIELDDGRFTFEVESPAAKEEQAPKIEEEVAVEVEIEEGNEEELMSEKEIRQMELGIDDDGELDAAIKTGTFARQSAIPKPCNRVWAIADAMRGERRKDIIAACVDHGVAYNTARTQYQHWYTANKNDLAAEAKRETK